MQRNERQVFNYDLLVTRRTELAPYPSLEDIAVAWEQMFIASRASHARERGTILYRIGDLLLDHDRGLLKILIRRGDINAPNPFFSHRQTGVTRAITRDAQEDAERAAHLIISTLPQTNAPNSYLCHLEGVPGISHRQVQAMLNSILKAAIRAGTATFDFPDPAGARRRDGIPKTTTFIPTIELLGHPSAAAVNDLEQGQIQSITLIDRRPHNQLGGNRYLTEKESYLVVAADPNMPRNGRLNSIIAAARVRRADFQSARIRFKDPSGVPHSVDYDIAQGTPEQQIYIASYTITNIDPPMDDSSLQLVPFITEVMSDRIENERT